MYDSNNPIPKDMPQLATSVQLLPGMGGGAHCCCIEYIVTYTGPNTHTHYHPHTAGAPGARSTRTRPPCGMRALASPFSVSSLDGRHSGSRHVRTVVHHDGFEMGQTTAGAAMRTTRMGCVVVDASAQKQSRRFCGICAGAFGRFRRRRVSAVQYKR